MHDSEKDNSSVLLTRDCMAAMVPSGARILLHEGTEVTIVQSLGNSMTVNIYGNLARIEKKDADALGLAVEDQYEPMPEGLSLEEQVWHKLKQVFDPEIPVNIVDLGLVYSLETSEVSDGGYKIDMDMTLTAPGCGMGPAIAEDAQGQLKSVPGVQEAEVNIVWDPPWDQDMISEEGKMILGLI